MQCSRSQILNSLVTTCSRAQDRTVENKRLQNVVARAYEIGCEYVTFNHINRQQLIAIYQQH